jgi:hypothetical protein
LKNYIENLVSTQCKAISARSATTFKEEENVTHFVGDGRILAWAALRELCI